MEQEHTAKIAPQISKFIVVGLLNTSIHFFILNVLSQMTGIQKGVGIAVITGIAFVAANTNSYFFNKNWTFKDREKEKEVAKFSTFFIVSVVGFFINISVVYLITLIPPFLNQEILLKSIGGSAGALWINFAALTAVFFSLIWNFIGYKYIVFKK